jgi:hypothetical protein
MLRGLRKITAVNPNDPRWNGFLAAIVKLHDGN